jgi:hypothetical protein
MDADFYRSRGRSGFGSDRNQAPPPKRPRPPAGPDLHDAQIADSCRASAVEVRVGPRPAALPNRVPERAALAGFAEAAGLLLSVGLPKLESTRPAGQRASGRVRVIPGVRLTGPGKTMPSPVGWSPGDRRRQPSEAVSELWDRWRIATRGVNNPLAVRFSSRRVQIPS